MAKRIILFSTLLLLSSKILFAQAQQKITPNWKIGDELTVVEKGHAKMVMFGLDVPVEINSQYQLKVKSKNESGYLIEVANMNFLSMTGGGAMAPIIKELSENLDETLKKAKSMKLLVRISTGGEVKDLENWQDVKSLMSEILTKMSSNMSKKYAIPKEKTDSILQVQLQKIDTKEEVMQQTLTTIEYIMSGYNVPFLSKGTLEVPSLIYSKMNYFEFNQKGLPATLKTKLELKNATKIKLYYDIIYSKEDLIKQLQKNSKVLSKQEAGVFDKMKMAENRSFEFDTASSWPSKIKMNVGLTLEGMLDIKIATEYFFTKK